MSLRGREKKQCYECGGYGKEAKWEDGVRVGFNRFKNCSECRGSGMVWVDYGDDVFNSGEYGDGPTTSPAPRGDGCLVLLSIISLLPFAVIFFILVRFF